MSKPELSPDPRGKFDPKIHEHLADIVITALESGLTTWVTTVSLPGKPPLRQPKEARSQYLARLLLTGYWELELELDETPIDGSSPRRHLTLPGLLWGIQMAAHRRGQSLQAWLDNHDADQADCAIQYAVFGHQVYN